MWYFMMLSMMGSRPVVNKSGTVRLYGRVSDGRRLAHAALVGAKNVTSTLVSLK